MDLSLHGQNRIVYVVNRHDTRSDACDAPDAPVGPFHTPLLHSSLTVVLDMSSGGPATVTFTGCENTLYDL